MESWPVPGIRPMPVLVPPVMISDSLTGGLTHASESATFSLYVCGITPYDATHLGHASTYLTYDLLIRLMHASGRTVRYTQNVTDVDDPLLERAVATGQNWQELAREQTDLFRADMQYLSVFPPTDYVAVSERILEISAAVAGLLSCGLAYPVPSDHAEPDIYLDVRAASGAAPSWSFGALLPAGASAEHTFDEHGGDSRRVGKRHPLDSLLWRSQRPGEPSWDVAGLPSGRPGWHVECAVIAAGAQQLPYDVQGGGSDLRYPHHDYSSQHAAAIYGRPLARVFSHVGLVSLGGEKMSKSLGNLVFIRDWRIRGVDPAAIRLAVFSHHYRDEWDWHDAILGTASVRLRRWRDAALAGRHKVTSGSGVGRAVAQDFAAALANDLDTVTAWSILDDWAAAPTDVLVVADAVSALTGVTLLDAGAS